MTRSRPDARPALHAWTLATLLMAWPAAAQQAGTGLPSREQIAPTIPEGQAPPPKVRIEDRAAPPPCDVAPSAEQVDLQTAEFLSSDGSPLPPDVRLSLAPVRPQRGLQPVSALCELRDRAAEALRQAGFIAAVAIPPQEIDGGAARFEVILAHFADVRLSGKPGRYARRLERRLAEIKALRPVNQHVLERMLLAIDDIPGLSLTLTLRPAGTEAGAIVGDLAVDYDPVSLLVTVDNLGSQAIGPTITSGRVEAYGLTGLSDRSYLGVATTLGSREQQLLQLGHYLGNGRGFSAGSRFSYARTRPSLPGFDIRSRSAVGAIDLTRQLLRAADRELTVSGGMEIVDQRVALRLPGQVVPISRDRLRVAFARLSGSVQAGRHMLAGQIEMRQGLAILNAGSVAATATGSSSSDASATVVRAFAEDVMAWGSALSLAATLDGQWSSGRLPGFEQYAIGNYTIGRGYDPGSASGDRALGVRLEPRLDIWPNEKLRPQLFGFIDHVRTWNAGTAAAGRDANGRFTSFGGGLRVTGPSTFAIEMLYAHRPGRRTVATGTSIASDRLLASIALRF